MSTETKNFTVKISPKAIAAAKKKAAKTPFSINKYVDLLFTDKIPDEYLNGKKKDL